MGEGQGFINERPWFDSNNLPVFGSGFGCPYENCGQWFDAIRRIFTFGDSGGNKHDLVDLTFPSMTGPHRLVIPGGPFTPDFNFDLCPEENTELFGVVPDLWTYLSGKTFRLCRVRRVSYPEPYGFTFPDNSGSGFISGIGVPSRNIEFVSWKLDPNTTSMPPVGVINCPFNNSNYGQAVAIEAGVSCFNDSFDNNRLKILSSVYLWIRTGFFIGSFPAGSNWTLYRHWAKIVALDDTTPSTTLSAVYGQLEESSEHMSPQVPVTLAPAVGSCPDAVVFDPNCSCKVISIFSVVEIVGATSSESTACPEVTCQIEEDGPPSGEKKFFKLTFSAYVNPGVCPGQPHVNDIIITTNPFPICSESTRIDENGNFELTIVILLCDFTAGVICDPRKYIGYEVHTDNGCVKEFPPEPDIPQQDPCCVPADIGISVSDGGICNPTTGCRDGPLADPNPCGSANGMTARASQKFTVTATISEDAPCHVITSLNVSPIFSSNVLMDICQQNITGLNTGTATLTFCMTSCRPLNAEEWEYIRAYRIVAKAGPQSPIDTPCTSGIQPGCTREEIDIIDGGQDPP